MDDSEAQRQRLDRVIEWRIRRAVERRERALHDQYKSRDRVRVLFLVKAALTVGALWLTERWGMLSGALAKLIERW